ncbi:MAG: guanylate kinase [Syntrophomonadaceae bacterium]|jgi:guanylate kinase|nr:guanylate kinase [Syntrophomonadaceae bacterium]
MIKSRNGILFVISGPSGVGKGTITKELFERISNIFLSVSVTTRIPRSGEIQGDNYFFVAVHEFERMVGDGELLEWARVYRNYYGTPRKFVLENLARKRDIILEIDIQGALQVKKNMPQGIFIFIAPPNTAELAKRIQLRGKDSEESMQTRLSAVKQELEHMQFYDYVVVNEDLELAVEKVKAIIIAERCRYSNILMEGSQ